MCISQLSNRHRHPLENLLFPWNLKHSNNEKCSKHANLRVARGLRWEAGCSSRKTVFGFPHTHVSLPNGNSRSLAFNTFNPAYIFLWKTKRLPKKQAENIDVTFSFWRSRDVFLYSATSKTPFSTMSTPCRHQAGIRSSGGAGTAAGSWTWLQGPLARKWCHWSETTMRWRKNHKKDHTPVMFLKSSGSWTRQSGVNYFWGLGTRFFSPSLRPPCFPLSFSPVLFSLSLSSLGATHNNYIFFQMRDWRNRNNWLTPRTARLVLNAALGTTAHTR